MDGWMVSPSLVAQAIGDGGQGWGNFILYVMVSKKVRNKLLTCCSRRESCSNLNNQLDQKSSSIYPVDGNPINYGTLKAAQEKVDSYEPTTAY